MACPFFSDTSASVVDMYHFVVILKVIERRKGNIADMIRTIPTRTDIDSKRPLMILRSLGGHLADAIGFLDRVVPREARSFIHFFDGEVGKMELTSKDERVGFAPSNYICPYHIWKPRGVLRSCTCSPTPAHQVRWEKKLIASHNAAAVRQASVSSDSTMDRGSLSGIRRKRLSTLSRTPGKPLVYVVRAVGKGFAGRFLRLCEAAGLRAGCQTELQKSGGPECRT